MWCASPQYRPPQEGGDPGLYDPNYVPHRVSEAEAAEQVAWLAVWSMVQSWGEQEDNRGHRNHCRALGFICDVVGVNDVLNCVEKPSWGACGRAALQVALTATGAGAFSTVARSGAYAIRSGKYASRSVQWIKDSRAGVLVSRARESALPPWSITAPSAEGSLPTTITFGENLGGKVAERSELIWNLFENSAWIEKVIEHFRGGGG